MQINAISIDNIPIIKPGDDLGNIICEAFFDKYCLFQ